MDQTPFQLSKLKLIYGELEGKVLVAFEVSIFIVLFKNRFASSSDIDLKGLSASNMLRTLNESLNQVVISFSIKLTKKLVKGKVVNALKVLLSRGFLLRFGFMSDGTLKQ